MKKIHISGLFLFFSPPHTNPQLMLNILKAESLNIDFAGGGGGGGVL